MSDVEIVIKVGEFLRAHPSLKTFLCGFLCGTLATIVIWLVCYFVAKKWCKEEDAYTPRLEKLDAFISERKGEKGMYCFRIVDDNGTITNIVAKCRTKAIEIYCQENGCSKEYVKEHCIIRHTNLSRSANW